MVCVCQQPNDEAKSMIQCNKCDCWYHFECVNVTVKDIAKDAYYCGFCSNNKSWPKLGDIVLGAVVVIMLCTLLLFGCFIYLFVEGDVLFSQKKDISLDIELEHEFNFGNGNHENDWKNQGHRVRAIRSF